MDERRARLRDVVAGWQLSPEEQSGGWRALRRSPGTTAAAMIMETNLSRGEDELTLSTSDFFAFRGAQHSFEVFGAWGPITINIAGDERPERVQAARVTAAALKRVRPALGRLFRADDEAVGGELVTILSYSLWRDRYPGDSTVIGRLVRVNGQPATVVGVMPDGFGFPREARAHRDLSPRRSRASRDEQGNPHLRPPIHSRDRSEAGLRVDVRDVRRRRARISRCLHQRRESSPRSRNAPHARGRGTSVS